MMGVGNYTILFIRICLRFFRNKRKSHIHVNKLSFLDRFYLEVLNKNSVFSNTLYIFSYNSITLKKLIT